MYRRISIQSADFSLDQTLDRLKQHSGSPGGVCFFVGTVRDTNLDEQVNGLFLEHYPGMTEAQLARILDAAEQRWLLAGAEVVHRIGALQPGDNIVLVAVAAAHRGEAFQACEMIMDYLKTQATFWKKVDQNGQQQWVESKDSDQAASRRWDPNG